MPVLLKVVAILQIVWGIPVPVSLGIGLCIAILCKTATHSSLSLKDLYGQLFFTIEDGCSLQYFGI
jgi:hypothetical protein